MKKLNVAMVLDDTLDRPDGVQQAVLLEGRWLSARGHTVSYLVADTTRADVPGVHSLGRFVSMKFNGNAVRTPLPVNGAQIRRVLAELRPDVVHVQMPCSPFLGARVVALAAEQCAVVGTFHILPTGAAQAGLNRVLGWALRPTVRRMDAAWAVSAPAAAFAQSAYGLECTVMPNPIETARFAVARQERRPDDGIVTVKFLGRLVERKGVLQLIRAFRALPPDVAARARLVIGGGGPLAQAARELAAGTDAISFAGFVDEADKPAFLAEADMVVLPSVGGESFGISLLEPMAAGAGMVLGGNNPGYASVLGGQPDSLVEPSDTAAFARALAHFISDAAARERLGREQHKLVNEFDIGVVGPKIEAVYEAALEVRQ